MPAFMPKSAYAEVMRGIHRPEAHTADPAIVADPYKMAMYGATATGIGLDMTAYQTAGETTGTGYTAGGFDCDVSVVDVVISGKDGEAYTFAPDRHELATLSRSVSDTLSAIGMLARSRGCCSSSITAPATSRQCLAIPLCTLLRPVQPCSRS